MSQVSGHAPGTPCWIDIMTPNPDGAHAFYKALFGWEVSVGGPEFGGYALASKDGQRAAGVGPKMPGQDNMPSVWTVYFATADIDASVAAVKAHGGSVFFPPMKVHDEGSMAICADPSGAVFGFWQAGNNTGAQVVSEPGALSWCEVNTRQGEAVRDFYASVLGLSHQPMPGMPYWTLHHGDKAVAGVLQMNEQWPDGVPAHWMAYIGVDRVDAACQTIIANGGTVCVPAFDTPYGRIAVVADPYGATFSIHQPAR